MNDETESQMLIARETRLIRDIPSGDSATQKTSLLERCLLVDLDDRNIGDDGVLRERRASHLLSKSQERVSFGFLEV